MTIFDLTSMKRRPRFELPRGYTVAGVHAGRRCVRRRGEAASPARPLAVLVATAKERCSCKRRKDARVLVLSGEPINEPVAAYGPFVMNTRAEHHASDARTTRAARWATWADLGAVAAAFMKFSCGPHALCAGCSLGRGRLLSID